MPKLTEYAEMAAIEYLQETGSSELDVLWIAEFFQDSGVQDEYPRQDLVVFSSMVQKLLHMKAERADKQAHAQLDKAIQFIRRPKSKN